MENDTTPRIQDWNVVRNSCIEEIRMAKVRHAINDHLIKTLGIVDRFKDEIAKLKKWNEEIEMSICMANRVLELSTKEEEELTTWERGNAEDELRTNQTPPPSI